VTATTGGQAPTRAIRRSSACISPCWLASRSTTATVASSSSKPPSTAASEPVTTRGSICSLAPKVERACSSKPASAVRTTTCVFFAGLLDRLILIALLALTLRALAARRPQYLTAAAGADCCCVVVWLVAVLAVAAAACACACVIEVVVTLTGGMTRLLR
jgi:hypothetical protein